MSRAYSHQKYRGKRRPRGTRGCERHDGGMGREIEGNPFEMCRGWEVGSDLQLYVSVFTWWMLASLIRGLRVFGDGQRVLPFLEEFIKSPALTRFAWSTLVKDALSANEHFFTDAPKIAARPLSPIRLLDSSDVDVNASAPIPGLLAVHVRRGDFVEHCHNLARWGSEYMGWLQSPLLIDRFNKPPTAGIEQTDAINNHYMKHCWPSIDEMVSKIDEVRWTSEGHGLKRVYVMTNGPTEWVEELKSKIMALGGWDGVATSRDLALIPEQKYIAQAVDMAVAMRSQVFIGNGVGSLSYHSVGACAHHTYFTKFSSLSANAVILRLSRKLNGLANRLW